MDEVLSAGETGDMFGFSFASIFNGRESHVPFVVSAINLVVRPAE
jgi:hypothetical protein